MTIGRRLVTQKCGYCGTALEETKEWWSGRLTVWRKCPERRRWWNVLLGRDYRHTMEFVRYEA